MIGQILVAAGTRSLGKGKESSDKGKNRFTAHTREKGTSLAIITNLRDHLTYDSTQKNSTFIPVGPYI
jgi:hypothetical protein